MFCSAIPSLLRVHRGIQGHTGGSGGITGLIQVHTDRAVDVLGDGLIWRLVLTADS